MDQNTIQQQIDTKGYASLTSDQKTAYHNFQAQQGQPASSQQSIGTSTLAPTTPIQLPKEPQPADNTNLVAGGNAGVDANAKLINGLPPPVPPTTESTPPSWLSSLLGSAPKPPESLVPQQADMTEYNAKLAAIQTAKNAMGVSQSKLAGINAQLEALNNSALQAQLVSEDRLAPMTAIRGEQAQIDRARALKALPLQSQAAGIQAEVLGAQANVAAAQGDADLALQLVQQAQSHLDNVFQAKLQDQQNQYEYQVAVYDKIWDWASEQERNRLDALKQEKQNLYNSTQDTLNYARDLANEAIANGQSSLASQLLALDPNKENYATEVARLATGITAPTANILDDEYKRAQIAQIYANIEKDKGKNVPITTGLTPEQQADPFIQKLLASAGGKPLTDTPIQQLNKGLSVLGQLGVLQENIKDTKTGPIIGAFKGANPWDSNAQTIKAILNGIVPNLARGIYGEVGVLTDNDIQIYAKTLPNLTSTEMIQNAVLGITVDLIGKSIQRTLEVNAAAGRDVSGFVDLYTEMINTRDAIFSQIPGYKGAGGTQVVEIYTPQEEDTFNQTVGDTPSEATGFWGNVWQSLTGN